MKQLVINDISSNLIYGTTRTKYYAKGIFNNELFEVHYQIDSDKSDLITLDEFIDMIIKAI